MPSLFQLINDDAALIERELDRLEAEGVPYEQAVEQAVAVVDQMTAEKALSYAKVILNLEAFADAAAERAKAMSVRGAARQAAADRLRQRMIELLPADFKAEDGEVKIRFQGSKRLDDSAVKDIKILPADLIRTIPAREEINKAHISELIKNGVILCTEDPPAVGKPKSWRLTRDGADIPGLRRVESLSVRIS